MKNDLRALWRFDEADGPLAFNAVSGGHDLQVRGAVREAVDSGRALRFVRGGDTAVAQSLGDQAAGTVAFRLRLDAHQKGKTIVSLHDQITLGTDGDSGERFIVKHQKTKLVSAQTLPVGQWTQIAVTFGAKGLTLYINGQRTAHDPSATAGITGAARGGAGFVTLCGLPSACVPCAIGDLAVIGKQYDDDAVRAWQCDVKAAPLRKQLPLCDIDAANYLDADDPTFGLQRAIDAAAPAGGRVRLPVGRFELRRSLELHSRVSLVGVGHSSILAAAPGFVTQLAEDVNEGDPTLTFADASGFAIGDAICVQDDNGTGYNASHAMVTAIENNTVRLSQATWFGYSAAREANAIVARWFPAVRGLYAHDVVIADLAIEGRAGIEPRTRVNFTASAIELERCISAQMRNIVIRNWLHDGICLGKGSWHRITDCVVRDGYGHGFHPGNRMRSCTWLNNAAINNGQDGFYFCCGVEDNLIANNLFERNAWNGIGDLGGCNDSNNLVTGNLCLQNGKAGIVLNGGQHNTVTNNICRANSQADHGKWAGIHIAKDTCMAVVKDNQVFDDQPEPTQREGITIEGGADAQVS